MQAEVCPTDWQEVPLNNVANDSFSSVDKKTHAGELPVRLCNYVDVYKNEYITRDLAFMHATATRPEIAQFGVRLGDVILTKDSETPDDIGIAALVDYTAPDLVCGYHLAMLRPKTNRVAPAFLAKQLRHPRLARYFGQQANGLTRYGLPKSAVQNAPMWIPREPKEGEKIAGILRQLDAAIRETEAVVAKLRLVKIGLLHDLLTRGLDENGKLRDPVRNPEQFQNSPLGQIPKTWDVLSFTALCDFPTGQVDPRQLPYRDWPLIAPDHIESETGRLLKLETAAQQGSISGKYVFESGDVIYSKIRPYLRKAVLADHNGLCSADMYPLRASARMNARFLLMVVLGEAFSRFAVSVSQRSGFPKINRDELAEYSLAVPQKEEQDRAAIVASTFESQLEAEESHLSKLHYLKRGLAHDLLTGRVRVKV